MAQDGWGNKGTHRNGYSWKGHGLRLDSPEAELETGILVQEIYCENTPRRRREGSGIGQRRKDKQQYGLLQSLAPGRSRGETLEH